VLVPLCHGVPPQVSVVLWHIAAITNAWKNERIRLQGEGGSFSNSDLYAPGYVLAGMGRASMGLS
jgi:hypothetical protein